MLIKNERIFKAGLMFTVNLGNYESLKIDCGVEMPMPEDFDFDKTYDVVYRQLENVIAREAENFQVRAMGKIHRIN